MSRTVARSLLLLLGLGLQGCLGMPDGLAPVQNFELTRYLGKWYEIARLDHSFERGLENVSAEYILQENGIAVINRGYSPEDGEWRSARGKAFFVNSPDEAYLKVSFFGPFYGSYVVFGLDHKHYQYAFVSGPNTSYLWLLSRSPSLPAAVVDQFRERAGQLGFDTRKLIMVSHDTVPGN